jgi:iron(III) transport system substrate-binding protein
LRSAGFAALAIALNAAPALAQQEFGSPELIAAAKAEGKLVYYTANFAEVEQQVIKAFNKRFPEIKVEMVRAPGGQLITRVKTEAAAGKLIADVVDHSDRALMAALVRPVPGLCAAECRRPTIPMRRFHQNCGRAPRWCGRSPTTPSW